MTTILELNMNIDNIDKRILKELLINSKQSIKDLAQKVELSVTPVHERIKKLESTGIIKGYSANLDIKKIGFNLVVYMNITLIRHQEELDSEIANYINGLDEVVEAYFVSGDFDLMVKAVLRDMSHYQEFVLHKMSRIDIISNVRSYFVIKDIKDHNERIYPDNL
ncbi:Lrp/AsnC family transcriptional regulator [Ornithobacterium rhinotracheale]|uniref:Transcriptional regulator n=2 Tax=Ornithobacterium rhinotracheale TaxID=28251 RepID=I4A0Y8_ORNRL|nr:Lrp/AsnC family transcriptional regulator [Ornithobacterium rhinotracheale]AIP98870.1 ArsR family transcriptional regulator [Ornithobacterium rhinotracheale ORT-UMN 88]AFL97622.1 transcriptional regulator [Ornithobacterium rhinotracheale DSM 15997]KGB66833.1 ArsR family transcriptional regulator [Ornithobacterium rhinotracheale H06-030791]MCK0202306.1 Lrp/AsnC family transcriptional regulator [Ornithobacterium rhinotracheale]MCK0204224.1 Lrp/AsnC family transcriptional regulator [Ornithobac